MQTLSLTVADFALKLLLSLMVFLCVFGGGAAVTGFIALGVDSLCMKAYTNCYRVAVLFDRLFHYKIRKLIRISVLVTPAVLVASSFYIAWGFPFTKQEIWTNPPPKPVLVSKELRVFKLLSFRPPKAYYVTLQDVSSGAIYKDLMVANSCVENESNKIGDLFNLQVELYRNADGSTTLVFTDVANVMCS